MARRRGNPLALAVLATLLERPMHPYELASTLRSRRKEDSIRLNYGSLYSVVQNIERAGLIEAQETTREGRRPERTVYAITESGRLELFDWLGELLSTPAKEYTNFEAGLSLMGVMPPEEVARLLDERAGRLREGLRTWETFKEMTAEQGLARVYVIELEYRAILQRAELDWIITVVAEIRAGSLDGLGDWREYEERFGRGGFPIVTDDPGSGQGHPGPG
ncbi:PadR family transcriptional regulator [Spongiactinospora sp. TRM90649]|uniref:PadR family transcriptional regulator n=1 Tax=Spongiactinospora sp. TRM90649 TaxID=3031114 RepID=UPI0023F66EF5|nr:PadR family transcriptional regulator [Spongiactinospora sp. TRM90649]MDF5758676.1 PadR family transcriptional regulator [Spongiactinospora sp. TRM90649]